MTASPPLFRVLLLTAMLWSLMQHHARSQDREPEQEASVLTWESLPPVPDTLGLAGPFVGLHQDVLIVGGGANFPKPVWESDKQWHDRVYAFRGLRDAEESEWIEIGKLPRALAYGASVSTPQGILCIGGNDANQLYADCFLLSVNPSKDELVETPMPPLPAPQAYGQACLIGDVVYLAGGQTNAELSSAKKSLLALDLGAESPQWSELPEWPGPSRAFNMCVAQNNGFETCLYMLCGRREGPKGVEFLTDCWEYNPRTQQWRDRAPIPDAMVAGVGVAFGQNHIFVLGGDNGALFHRSNELRDAHPGFPKQAFAYHAITNSWRSVGPTPANHVTTSAVVDGSRILLPTGEVRPRVRSPAVWSIRVQESQGNFGTLDYLVLTAYLLLIIGIGAFFAMRKQDSDEYFRGGGRVPWWAAGCSIFATMLSSLTFTGVPSKSFSQDWVYAIGNFMIPIVAVVAVFIALPFFRRVASASAYEYLGQRFHWSLRVFGSLMFSTFHIFRMALVMSLTALALAVATPLTPEQSVLVMGILSVIYCSIGGVQAVIWTDTLQTFVLLGGAVLAIWWMLSGIDLSLTEAVASANEQGKLNLANWHWNPQTAQLALWVVVLGAFGQNLSSYTADQAVVQRYMTTENERLAARSIWTNAVLTIPATILFFGIGSSLFLFYQAYPERLAPDTTADQIFPYFIAQELPIGLSGLIVAAVFAAAQSTISTSMNSVATTLTTDCIQPLMAKTNQQDRLLLRSAQTITVVAGICGTLLAMRFIDPSIRSRFDDFIVVIGLFMGVLGGLFVLGFSCPKANAVAAWTGALAGIVTMCTVFLTEAVQGYLFTAVGIASCVIVGWLVSKLLPGTRDRNDAPDPNATRLA